MNASAAGMNPEGDIRARCPHPPSAPPHLPQPVESYHPNHVILWGFPGDSGVRIPPEMQEIQKIRV